MDPIERAYWLGARDMALFELNELNRGGAAKKAREVALRAFLAAAERGNELYRSEIAPYWIRLSDRETGRRSR
jgi:hypothetical protein